MAEPQAKLGQDSGIGYELVLALDVPVLQMVEQPVDASALAFLEEAEAKDLEVEYMELARSGFSQSPAWLERTREVVRRRQVLRQKGRGRKKKKKRRKRKLPKGSSPRSLPARAVLDIFPVALSVVRCLGAALRVLGFWIFGDGFCDVSVFCAQLGPMDTRTCVTRHLDGFFLWWFPRPLVSGSHLFYLVLARGVQYVVYSGRSLPDVVFGASWFDSGYMLLPVYGFWGALFPYTAHCLVLRGTRYTSVTEFASSISLSWSRGRFPWSYCSADHSNSPELLNTVIDVPVVQVAQLPRCGPDMQKTLVSHSCSSRTRW